MTHALLLAARVLLAAVFAFAAAGKLADRAGSRRAVAGFGAPERLVTAVAALLPLAELAVAAALLPPQSARFGALGALALLTIFIAAITHAMVRGEAPDCHCFGALHSEPAGWRTLVRDLVLAGVAALVVAAGWTDAGPSAVAWIGRLHGAALAGGAGLALSAASAWFMLGLLRQHGRLLLRIDELQARLDRAGVAAVPAQVVAPGHGLPVGEPAPDFSLDGLYGETVTLESLTSADRPVILLFTDPACSPCNALMPEIAGWQREHGAELSIAVITRGTADDNRAKVREHGIASVWLDTDLAVYEAYKVQGTPAAVLIDGDRQIASAVGGGADAIAALVDQATNAPLQVVRVAPAQPQAPPPQGLPVGVDAPDAELADLDGKRVAIVDEQRDTLVLFWNPGCGFCQQMLDQLRAFEADLPEGAPRLLLVSTGTVDDNRAMGLRAPIALDQGFTVGTAFGTSGTPSAVRVDTSGKIASSLGIGAPAVMALAQPGRSRDAV